MSVSIHDIRVGDTDYIMEWFHDSGHIAITEACDRGNEEAEPEDGYECSHETFDFKEV